MEIPMRQNACFEFAGLPRYRVRQRRRDNGVKGAVAETYYSSEIGMKELGWDGSVAFAPPSACA